MIRFRLSTLLFGILIFAVVCSSFFVPRWRETKLQRDFREDGDLTGSWVVRHPRSWLDVAIGFDGFVKSAIISGEDTQLQTQLAALQGFRSLQKLDIHSVATGGLLAEEYSLPSVKEASLSDCVGDFVEPLLTALTSVAIVRVIDCETVADEHLRGLPEGVLSLEIDGSAVTGEIFSSGWTATLSRLEMEYSPLSNSGVAAIARIRTLKSLRLRSSGDRLCVAPLGSLVGLDRLELVDFVLTNSTVRELVVSLPETRLLVDGNPAREPVTMDPGRASPGSDSGFGIQPNQNRRKSMIDER